MSYKIGSFSLLILITLLFTAGLVYATIELPGLINLWLIQTFDFPGVDSSLESSITDAFIQSHHLRLIGIGPFAAVVALIVVGLVAEKRRLASVGAFAFFLPVFGHYLQRLTPGRVAHQRDSLLWAVGNAHAAAHAGDSIDADASLRCGTLRRTVQRSA